MSAETFLILAEQGGFLEGKTVNKLRNKLANSSRTVTAEELANLLVQRQTLTDEQSQSLLKATQAASSGELQVAEDFDLRPSTSQDTEPSLQLLGEQPQDELTLLEPMADDPTPVADSGGFMEDGPQEADEANSRPSLTPSESSDSFGFGGGSDFDALMGEEIAPAPPKGVIATLRSLFERTKYKGQRWDSSLMMVGGGGLLLLLLAGGALYYVLTSGSGDEFYQLAEDDYKAQLYAQAIQKYDRFVTKFPRHEKVSLANVRIGLAHMRSEVESKDWNKALDVATKRIQQIRPEDRFPDARPELAGILPEIYEGFVREAGEAATADAKDALLDKANEAFALIDNPEYLPGSQRQQIQSRLNRIEQEIELVERDIDRRREISNAISSIEEAVTAGDSASAYDIRDQLLADYPGASKDERFRAVVLKIADAEQRSVVVSQESTAATTEDHVRPVFRQVTLVARRGSDTSEPALKDCILYTLSRGGLYAVDGATGELLWRRWLGFESHTRPTPSGPRGQTGVLVVDHRHQELVRLEPRTGKLVWRTPIGPSRTPPVATDTAIWQTVADGALLEIDNASGAIRRKAQFPQPISSPPAYDAQQQLLFQPGHHSTLYVLDAKTLECVDTIFLGHSDGMIQAAPAVTKDHVLVIENSAKGTSRMHVLARSVPDTNSPLLSSAGQPITLQGNVVTQPITFDRNVLVTTDRGAVYVLDSDAQDLREPMKIFAQVHPQVERTTDHFGLLSSGRMLVAGTGLSEFEISAARSDMRRRWVQNISDRYLTPPELYGDVIVTRRQTQLGDVVVQAAKLPPENADGEIPEEIWATHVGSFPAGQPTYRDSQRAFLIALRNGTLWSIDTNELRAGIAERNPERTTHPVISQSVVGSGGLALFHGRDDASWQFVASDSVRPRRVQFAVRQTRLATPPVVFGEALLLCDRRGPVHLAAADTGKQLAEPFQIPLSRGERVQWLRPATDGDAAWVATTTGVVARIEQSEGRLTATKTVDSKTELKGPVVQIGDAVLLIRPGVNQDSLMTLSATTLEPLPTFDVSARIAAGPYAIGDVAVLITHRNEWMAIEQVDGKLSKRWQQPLPVEALAGAPLPLDGRWVAAGQGGTLFCIDPTTGSIVPWSDGTERFELEQPLGSSPVIAGPTLLISGSDGTLCVVPQPKGR